LRINAGWIISFIPTHAHFYTLQKALIHINT